MNLILLMVTSLSLSGCFDPKDKFVYKPDFQLNECRKYKIIQSDPEILIQLEAKLTLESCEGIWGVDTPTFGKIVREWNAEQAKEDAKKE